MRSIVDQRLRPALRNLYESVCAIHSVTITESDAGQPLETLGDPVPGMEAIPCRIGPLILIRPTDNEVRTSRIQSNYIARQCDLSFYLPNIQVRLMRAVVDGVEYPIRGVEPDGSRFKTRLRLEVINP